MFATKPVSKAYRIFFFALKKQYDYSPAELLIQGKILQVGKCVAGCDCCSEGM